MKYLPEMTEAEVHYICSVIPLSDSISYFRWHPKEFAKIMPGFRAKSLKNQEQVSSLLFRTRNHHFISSFLEKHISEWLSQIREHLAQLMEEGESTESALLHTLPFSFFVDNVALYFKLINEKYSEENITLLSAAVTEIKEALVKKDKLQEELKAKESEIEKLKEELSSGKSKLEGIVDKQTKQRMEIKELKRSIALYEEQISSMQTDRAMIISLESKMQIKEKIISNLRDELAEAKNNNLQLEAQIRSEIEVQRAFEQQAAQNPRCPRDIEEFKDYLGYNLESIGIPANSKYFALLKEHLSKVLFLGTPIIVCRGVGFSLIKCIANGLIGQSNVNTLAYDKGLSIEDINWFLSDSERIACLDNFIGNFNETELLPLFDVHKNKIIFLTVAYDRTIQYVSREFLRYCLYLNLNRIVALSANVELTEEPSMIEEVETEPQRISPENRYAMLMREMLAELGFSQSLVEKKCAAISNEQDLCRILAFDVLPYCVDVMQIAPYNTSERLNKYAGNSGRCSYKELFKGWFA